MDLLFAPPPRLHALVRLLVWIATLHVSTPSIVKHGIFEGQRGGYRMRYLRVFTSSPRLMITLTSERSGSDLSFR